MKPPTCYVCGRTDDPETELVSFADFQPLKNGMTGHPHGLEWFCSAHRDSAKRLSHLPIEQAMQQLRRRITWTEWFRRFAPRKG
jgi:hypothetical protein